MTEEDPRPDGPPDAPPDRDDEVWAQLVATFHASPSAPEGRAAAGTVGAAPGDAGDADDADDADDAGDDAARDTGDDGSAGGTHGRDDPVGPGPAQLGPRSYVPPEPDEHFVPPPPAPLPPLHPVARVAWWGTIGGPVFLLGSALVGWTPPPWLVALAMVAFVAGFVTLVARMRRGDGDETDDGAVV